MKSLILYSLSAMVLLLLLLCMGQCRSHVIVKRSDYRAPLEEEVNSLSSELENLKSKLNTLQSSVDRLSTQVGFTVQMSQDSALPAHSTVKFDRRLYDQGGNFNTSTGFFTAPIPGVYSFFLSCEVHQNEEMGYLVIQDGVSIMEVHAGKDDNFAQTASSHVVLHLKAGQRVWVRSFWSDGIARAWTSFGGALLTPDV